MRGTYYYLSDGAASVAGLTGSAGTLVDSYAYDPQRNITSQSGTVPNSFTFQGWMWDGASGLYYTGSGYYDPTTAGPEARTSSSCHDQGWTDPGEDACGEDEWDNATQCVHYIGKQACVTLFAQPTARGYIHYSIGVDAPGSVIQFIIVDLTVIVRRGRHTLSVATPYYFEIAGTTGDFKIDLGDGPQGAE